MQHSTLLIIHFVHQVKVISPRSVGDTDPIRVLKVQRVCLKTHCLKAALLASQGRKSSKEKFAGSLFTTTVEAFVPTNGRGIQVRTPRNIEYPVPSFF